jgi:hypothetical protein
MQTWYAENERRGKGGRAERHLHVVKVVDHYVELNTAPGLPVPVATRSRAPKDGASG